MVKNQKGLELTLALKTISGRRPWCHNFMNNFHITPGTPLVIYILFLAEGGFSSNQNVLCQCQLSTLSILLDCCWLD